MRNAELRDATGAGVPRVNEPETRQAGTPAATKPSRLWLWFVAAFVLQAAAWVAWFAIASQHKVQEVPLETGRAGFSPLSSSGHALVATNTSEPERAEARPTLRR